MVAKRSPVKTTARKTVGKVTAAVKRKFTGEHICESCRKRVGYHRSNRMYQCGDCGPSIRKLGGGFSLERRNFPRGHSVRADRQRGY